MASIYRVVDRTSSGATRRTLRDMNAIDFECPECGAKAGERCNTRTGKAQPVSHARRKRLAFDEKMRRDAEEGVVTPDPNRAQTE